MPSKLSPAGRRIAGSTNNQRLRSLLTASGLTQQEALDRLNKNQARPVSLSALKSWLSSPESQRHRSLSGAMLAHAERTLASPAKAKL